MSYGERIPIKSRREIEKMREAARYVAEILLELREMTEPGVTTADLAQHAKEAIEKRGVRSPFLGYSPGGVPPYPAVLCASVNEEIVHGIPGKRELVPGDIVSLDFAVECDGFFGDSACTIPVGPVVAEDAPRPGLAYGGRFRVLCENRRGEEQKEQTENSHHDLRVNQRARPPVLCPHGPSRVAHAATRA